MSAESLDEAGLLRVIAKIEAISAAGLLHAIARLLDRDIAWFFGAEVRT